MSGCLFCREFADKQRICVLRSLTAPAKSLLLYRFSSSHFSNFTNFSIVVGFRFLLTYKYLFSLPLLWFFGRLAALDIYSNSPFTVKSFPPSLLSHSIPTQRRSISISSILLQTLSLCVFVSHIAMVCGERLI